MFLCRMDWALLLRVDLEGSCTSKRVSRLDWRLSRTLREPSSVQKWMA